MVNTLALTVLPRKLSVIAARRKSSADVIAGGMAGEESLLIEKDNKSAMQEFCHKRQSIQPSYHYPLLVGIGLSLQTIY